jgi:hypothetical protein
MKSMCCCDIWSKIAVRTAAGVTQLARMPVLPVPSQRLGEPDDRAFDALYADGVRVAFLPGHRRDVHDSAVVLLQHGG